MEPPVKPLESDCCNSGCNPCILDFYEIQLKKYQKSLEQPSNPFLPHSNAINETSYTQFVLKSRREVCPSIFELEFAYADRRQPPASCLRFSAGQHFLLKLKDTFGEFTRAYSPLRPDGLRFKVIVKVYKTGRASRAVSRLAIGARTSWRGPYGDFLLNYNTKYFIFVAQGTGIVPVFGVIRELVENEACESFVKLFYCCKSGEILFRDEIYGFCSYWNFSCEFFLGGSEEIEGKYKEVLHFRRLEMSDLESYLCGKSDLQGIVCGSGEFNDCITNYLESLVEMKSNIFVL